MRLSNSNLAGCALAALAIVGGISLASCRPKDPAAANRQSWTNSPTNPDGSGYFTPANALTCLGAKGQIAPSGQPADDIVGVRAGMSPADVARVIGCFDKTLLAQASPDGVVNSLLLPAQRNPTGSIVFFVPPEQNFKDQKKNENRFTVHFAGVKGQEEVVQIEREYHIYGRAVSLATITSDLKKKYGPPSLDDTGRPYAEFELWWIFDSDGQPMSDKNPSFVNCETINTPTAGCGLVIHANITKESVQSPSVNLLDLTIVNHKQELAAIDRETALLKAQAGSQATGQAPKL